MESRNETITRSDNRVIAGVIGGFAEYYALEPTVLRLAVVFLVVATGLVPGIVTYGAAVVLMPKSPRAPSSEPG